MGEIGIPRREFLYELRFWEVSRIISGYRKRGWITNQLIAEAVFAATYSMRDPKGRTVKHMFLSLFEDDDLPDGHQMTEEETKEVQQLIDDFNWGEVTDAAK